MAPPTRVAYDLRARHGVDGFIGIAILLSFHFTGLYVAWFKDPDGNILSLSEHPEFMK